MVISTIKKILKVMRDIVLYAYKYRKVYTVAGAVATRKFEEARNFHKYAILVAARNEETVIGNLIESIRSQDYPEELVTVFVAADNCTDNTADVARSLGAVCYERHDTSGRTKGYALQFLVEQIKRDYGIDSFEAYFVFDADNLLAPNYLAKMNDAFDSGQKIVTSYRNTKNFDDNWISASYALHWMRTIRTEHRARSLIGVPTRIQGTGFMFSWEVIKDGWNYVTLTEDRAFCADVVTQGYTIAYQNEAEFYDEQPTDLAIAWRQRMRWAKGHIQALRETGGKLFIGIFKNIFRWRSFHCFDMLTVVFPSNLFWLITDWILIIFALILNKKGFAGVLNILWIQFLLKRLKGFIKPIATAAYVFVFEHRHIPKIKWYRKVWFCLTFPIFDIIGKITVFLALFVRVEWKPIPHNVGKKIDEMKV